jgi:hypothetical protein
MTATDAMVGETSSRPVDVDRLERRYRLAYPLHVFLENARQVVVVFAVGLTIAASVIFLSYSLSSADKAPIEISVFLVTAFASVVAAGYITLWDLTVRNFWKFGGLLTLVLALAIIWVAYGIGVEVASPIAGMLTQLTAAAPLVALLLLAVIALAAAYYAHLIWALLGAAFVLALGNTSDRKLLRDRPPRTVTRMGFFSRFWGFPPLYRFARGKPLRYLSIVVLSLFCAFCFSIVAVSALLMNLPIDQAARLGKRCGSDDACLVTGTLDVSYSFLFLMAALTGCVLAGWVGQRLLRRLLRFSLEALQEADSRPPVLFLRAFRDDQVPCARPGLRCSDAFWRSGGVPIRSINCCSTKPRPTVRWSDSAARPTSVRLTVRPAAISPPRRGRTRSRNLRRAQPSL